MKCKELTYTPITPLTFRISGGTKILIPHKNDDGIIHSLESSEKNGMNIPLGLTLEIKMLQYKINIIEEKWKGKVLVYDLSIAKRTKSSIFILPMFGGDRNLFLWNQLFLNCFILQDDENSYIQLLYRFSSDPLFLKFEQALTKFPSFLDREDPHDGLVLFTFNIPERQKRNFHKFLKGKYSELGKLYKLNILEFHNYEIDSLIGKVLFKDESRRIELGKKLGVILPPESELLSIVNINEEIYNHETYNFKKLI